MSMTYSDPFDVLLSLQRALEARRASDWLRDATTSMGSFPPINVFQQGDDFIAIIELPGVTSTFRRRRTPSASPAGNRSNMGRVPVFTAVSGSQESLIEP